MEDEIEVNEAVEAGSGSTWGEKDEFGVAVVDGWVCGCVLDSFSLRFREEDDRESEVVGFVDLGSVVDFSVGFVVEGNMEYCLG